MNTKRHKKATSRNHSYILLFLISTVTIALLRCSCFSMLMISGSKKSLLSINVKNKAQILTMAASVRIRVLGLGLIDAWTHNKHPSLAFLFGHLLFFYALFLYIPFLIFTYILCCMFCLTSVFSIIRGICRSLYLLSCIVFFFVFL